MSPAREPQRMCCHCRTRRPQKELVRIVRTGGTYEVEKNVRLEGRSAYVCPDRACIEGLLKKRSLDRSFRANLGSAVYEKLAKELEQFG